MPLLFQSHQARIATLYLPLFGLLIENVQRINVKDVSPFPVNPGNVRKQSRGRRLSVGSGLLYLRAADPDSEQWGGRLQGEVVPHFGPGWQRLLTLSFPFASVPTWRSVFVSPPPFLFL